VRQQHPSISLHADFVVGMRDHANALKAMLLYMDDTWTNLAASSVPCRRASPPLPTF